MAEGKSEEEIMRWYEHDLLPRLLAEGRLPLNILGAATPLIIDLSHEESDLGTDHFASKPYFTQITVQSGDDSENKKKIYIIAKFITQKIAAREAMETHTQFYNEMVFYNQIVSAFRDFLKGRPRIQSNFLEDIFPVCRYAHMDLNDPDYGVVIMDDLRHQGYTCAESKAELSLDYCLIALRKLAKLHAISYAMKIENFQSFKKLAHSFRECLYKENRHMTEKDKDIIFSQSCLRGINYLLEKKGEVPESYLLKLKSLVLTGACKIMRSFMQAKEPLAVICHGDFCRNNILFLMKNDKPINCRLFDFQTWRYATPAIDLTFFLYMNTTLELREKYFVNLLKTYHETVIDTISLITLKSNFEVKEIYPFELFYKDFGEHALYGYTIIANFLPVMMVPLEKPADFEEEFREKSAEELAKDNVEHGGEVVTKRISEVVVDMYRRKFYM